MACQIIYDMRKCDHISDKMKDLLWLKIDERITYKVSVIMLSIYNKTAPKYLRKLIPSKPNSRQVRLSTSNYLPPTICKTSAAYNRSLSSMGPQTWNSLSEKVRSECNSEKFKRKLKTYLLAYHTNVNLSIYSSTFY